MATTASEFRFTLDEYGRLLSDLQARGYEFVGYDDPGEREIIMRHDVDLSPERAAAMADAEAWFGVSSTYFFLVGSPAYDLLDPANREAVEEVRRLGHDVGLHFDVHRHWDEEPPLDDLVDRIEREAASLERLVGEPVDVVSFHVPPDWVLGRELPSYTNAYAPRYFGGATYRSDSNQKWREEPPFGEGPPETMQLLVHPGLWHERDRSLDCIIDDHRDRRNRAIDGYFDLLGR